MNTEWTENLQETQTSDVLAKPSSIVVVDDEPHLCSLIADYISEIHGTEVISFTDPIRAVDHIRNNEIDLVITDLVIGEGSGVDILDVTRSTHPDSIVILMTAFPTVKTAISVLQKGGYDYLVKPFKLDRLRSVVERGLDTLHTRRENIRLKAELGLLKVSSALLSDFRVEDTLSHVMDAATGDLDAIGVSFSFQSGSVRIDSFKEMRLTEDDADARAFLCSQTLGLDCEEVRQRIVKADNIHGQERTYVSLPLRSGDSFFGWLKVVFGRGCRDIEMRVLELLTASASAAVGRTLLNERLTGSNLDALRALANAIEARDRYTGGHTDRVTKMAEMVARELGWGEKRMLELKQGCTLHDIGKIGVPDAILNKSGPLDEYETNIMRKHPEMGVHIITGIDFLKIAVPYILFHHERYDGEGYPMRLKAQEIPIEGRILAVADTFDAIVSDRPYRRGAPHEKAIKEIRINRGLQFDPEIADLFLKLYDEHTNTFVRLYSNAQKGKQIRDLISEF